MNLQMLIMTSIENFIKYVINIPLQWMYVNKKGESVEVGFIEILIRDKGNKIIPISKNNSRFTIQKKWANEFFLLQIKRYKNFLEVMTEICKLPIEIIEIAGQERIQLKLLVPRKFDKKIWGEKCSCLFLYEWPILTDDKPRKRGVKGSKKYCAVDVMVSNLNIALKSFREMNIQVVYMHDF